MGSQRTKDFLILNYLAGVVFVSFAQLILPDRFFLDAEEIKDMIPGASFQFSFFDSYNNTAYLYKLLGMGAVLPDWVAAFLSYSIPFLLMGLVARQQKWFFNSLTAVLFGMWNILMAVYLGMFTKEVWAFSIVAIVMLLSGTRRGIIFGLIFAMIYAGFFRVYWFLVIGFFIVNFWSARTGKSLKFMVSFQVFLAIFVFILANVATGQYLSETRYDINLERTDDGVSEAETMINNVFANDSPIKDWMNGTIIWGSLLIPFFLLVTAQVQHILFFGFQIINVIAFIWVVRFLLPKTRSPFSGLSKKNTMQVHAATAWCVAYSFVQGIFEPDFGSFARHQIILAPMWFSLISCYNKLRTPAVFHRLPGRTSFIRSTPQEI